ncbi:hypothetical protein [Streptomyces sp. NPDC003393]
MPSHAPETVRALPGVPVPDRQDRKRDTAATGPSTREETAPAPVSLYTSAGAPLVEHGLDEQRSAVHLELDHPSPSSRCGRRRPVRQGIGTPAR